MTRPRLAVWIYGTLAAQVEDRGRGGLRLRHTPAALDRWPINTPLISCSLPVVGSWAPASVYLRGLLPEGAHLQAAAHAANVATSDTYGLLARFGRDVAGALVITRHDEAPDVNRWGAQRYTDATLASTVEDLEAGNPLVHDDSELSLPGLQNKVLLVDDNDTWARPTGGRPSTHILKIDDLRFPGLVEAEGAALQLAHQVGLTDNAPRFETINGRVCLIVERYDRKFADGVLTRVHQEDACQALGVSHEANHGRGKYEHAGGPSFRQVAGLLRDHTEDAAANIDLLARHMTFTRIIGNADAHGKNVAFLHDEHGAIRLAPLYDTVPTVLWPQLRTRPAMLIGSATDINKVTFDALVDEAASWGAGRSAARDAINDTIERIRHTPVAHEPLANQISAAISNLR